MDNNTECIIDGKRYFYDACCSLDLESAISGYSSLVYIGSSDSKFYYFCGKKTYLTTKKHEIFHFFVYKERIALIRKIKLERLKII
jgi:hypothetical protein